MELHADQRLMDIVAEGNDAGIRNRRAIQQDMVTTRLTGPFKAILVASKNHLDAKGTPKSIADLHEHNCIGARIGESGPIYEWEINGWEKARICENIRYSSCDRHVPGARFGFWMA